MFSHVTVGARNLEESKAFYNATFATLGVGPGSPYGQDRVFYSHSEQLFTVVIPIDGNVATFANGGTIGFKVGTRDQVDAWHAAGVNAGGVSCEDPPGIRDGGPTGQFYLAYLRDPVGNKLCAYHRLEG